MEVHTVCVELHAHSCNLSPAPPAPLVYFFPAGVLFSTKNAKGTTPKADGIHENEVMDEHDF